jgi:arylsulfatase A
MPKEGERYANPFIIQNGKKLGGLENAYGPDVFNEFVCDFIDRQGKEQFFVYYPMVLVHDPFVPTPESPEWSNTSGRYEKNTRHFREMVEYMDKLVGKLEAKLREKGVLDNTIFIFTGDNGTNVTIATETVSGTVKGAKSFTIDAGCHVPLIISWPSEMKNSRVYQPLIEFSDFLPTLVEAAGTKNRPEDIDGKSFLKVLKGETRPTRETVFVHYDPQWGKTGENRNRFAQTTEYKLYRDQRFYKYSEDLLEQHPLTNLTPAEKAIRQNLQSILDRAEKESPWILERPKATGNQ